MESIEASGKSVEEAVQQALARLGKRRDEVEITVLQEAARGAFGLGSKDARVRVTVRPNIMSAPGVSTSIPVTSASRPGAVITPEMADAILGPDAFEDEEGLEVDEYEEEEEGEFEDE